MRGRKRYTRKTVSAAAVAKLQREFLKRTGPTMKLMWDFADAFPNIALTVKDRAGRIVFTNRFNAAISGWTSSAEMIGYTSQELYPPDLAAVYSGRDREVLETGVPIVERVYGFVADRSTSLNCVTVRPVEDARGRRIGTVTVYWRAERKLKVANWYDPIRKAVVHLNEHYAEGVSVKRLAALANYSEAQFRRRFRELTQMSPSDYVLQVRLNAAKTLLTTTDRLITDIANETGFYDHAHFIRAFRASTGTTPAAYRRSLR